MKIVTKQVMTTVIDDDGDFENTVEKTVSIKYFDSLSVDEIHDTIATSLRNRIKSQLLTGPLTNR